MGVILTPIFLYVNVSLESSKNTGGAFMNYELIKFENGGVELEVNVSPEEETVWLSLNEMCLLFERDKSVISRHIKNIFKEGELDEKQTVAKNATVQNEGNKTITRNIEYYNLDVIISVGYRVKSKNGVAFRKWANSVLKDYLLKGYVINDNRTLITKENYLNLVNRVDSIDKRVGSIENAFKHRFVEDVLISEGETFDAIVLIAKMLETAHSSIILIDPYVDALSLNIMKNKEKETELVIVTSSKASIGRREIASFSERYGNLKIKIDDKCHDRYLIIDNELFYHLGCSINYIGKRLSQITLVRDGDIISALKKRLNNLLKEDN